MFWTLYDRGTGGSPKIGDRVETCHFGEAQPDGAVTGVFAGWASFDRIAGIIILDAPLKSGELAISVPAVCLRLRSNYNQYSSRY